ncbi:MAG: Eco57I restriction-modification methylase domain-containing protein [Methanobrevibacter sp. CfCl-M3]
MINNLLQLKNGLKKYGGNIKTIQYLYDSNSKLQEWYKSYESDSLEKEEENYTYFASTFLTGVLGYIDQTDFNHEKKLGKGKSADFIILKDGEPYIVIELKGSKTNLDKKYNKKPSAVDQAFDYGSEKKSIEWVIVSNYYEFRLYHKNTKENMVSFNLDELIYHNGNKHILQLFLLVFSKESVLDHDNLNKLYDEDQLIIERENINKNFYNLYHHTRILLIDQLQDKGYDKENSITYSGTILNRVIFICFCEDMGLLPSKSINNEILEPVEKGRLGDNRIWRGLNDLWKDVDHGNPHIGVPSYNGGLFKENLNNLDLSDEIKSTEHIKVSHGFKEKEENIDNLIKDFPYLNPIYRNLLIISSFNYSSELNVNILGHIFEQSITDIEKLKKGEEHNQRKKHGIYYTPEAITTYICENTIIPYLSRNCNNTMDGLIEEYSNDLNILEDKLRSIKIIDPACGSGALLNKATDTLLDIYKAVHDYKYKNDNNLKPFFDDIDQQKNILLNNIYGMDLNKQSVEITKLSLFLKVAQSEDRLPDLDHNIKCGDSLIEDPNYTSQPFNWEEEFNEVFDSGGFDVVIGNPPYVRQEKIKEFKPYFQEHYETYTGVADLYVYFFEKGLSILKSGGYLGFICSNKWTRAKYGAKLRSYLLNYNIVNYNDYTGEKVFTGATVDPSVIIIQKKQKDVNNEIAIERQDNSFVMEQNRLDDDSWAFEPPEILNLRDKIMEAGTRLKDIPDININYGIKTGYNEAFIVDEETKNDLIAKDPKNSEIIKPLLRGRDIHRWSIDYQNLYLITTKNGIDVPKEYPTIYEHLKLYEDKLAKRYDQGEYWYNLRNCAYYEEFETHKIIYPNMAKSLFCIFDDENWYTNQKCFILTSNTMSLKFLSALFSSKLLNFYFKLLGSPLGSAGYDISKIFIEQLPIVMASKEEQKPLIDLTTKIIAKNKELQKEIKSFQKYLKSDFKVTKINKKLTEYYNLGFEDLYAEVKKQYKDLTRKEKDKLEKEYNESIAILKPLQVEIANIDKEIDKLVYELYNLTEDEIAIIEK